MSSTLLPLFLPKAISLNWKISSWQFTGYTENGTEVEFTFVTFVKEERRKWGITLWMGVFKSGMKLLNFNGVYYIVIRETLLIRSRLYHAQKDRRCSRNRSASLHPVLPIRNLTTGKFLKPRSFSLISKIQRKGTVSPSMCTTNLQIHTVYLLYLSSRSSHLKTPSHIFNFLEMRQFFKTNGCPGFIVNKSRHSTD